jgi:hypothetical protein
MAKKARIMACPKEEATETSMANRLCCQKLTKENLADPSIFMPPGGSRASSKVRNMI